MTERSRKGIFLYKDVIHEDDGTLTVGGVKGVPDISGSDIGEVAAWFLGPRAENHEVLTDLIKIALEKAIAYRREFEPDDPQVITEEVKNSSDYKQAVNTMTSAFESLVDFLQKYATPYFSMRYQAHMLWDNSLPALAAYFATMLHNPNNVTIQASSATTPLEILVGWDLCGMIGFPVHKKVNEQEYNPWAHITCDGSVANIEACWVGREAKFLPLAIRRMLFSLTEFTVKSDAGNLVRIPIDNSSNPIDVLCCDGTHFCLTDSRIDCWPLFNITLDEILSLPKKIAEQYEIDDIYVIWSAVVPYTLNYLGWMNMMQYIHKHWPEAKCPVILAPSTMHYSIPKAAAVLGYGFGAPCDELADIGVGGCVFNIAVDEEARMDMEQLDLTLDFCLQNKIPVSQVVGVTGTTEEGSVDSLEAILQKRKVYRAKGLEYFVHADAAWGGYIITAMRKPYTLENSAELAEINPDLPPYVAADLFVTAEESGLSDYVYQQFAKLCECDSVTIDPHKMGYVQYPAGSIAYRNGIVRRLTTFTGAYIGGTGSVDPGAEPTVGIYGLEGSKPGAAAAAVFLNHRVIRPDVTGHGKIIRQCMENTKLFALYLMALNSNKANYRLILLCEAGDIDLDLLSEKFLVMNQSERIALIRTESIRNFGPDLNILDYVFVPLSKTGAPRIQCIEEVNAFNLAVYNKFHVPVSAASGRAIPVPIDEFPRYFLTKTTFNEDEYGERFMDRFLESICQGFAVQKTTERRSVVCLRSVIMDPFLPYAEDGDFFKTIIEHIDKTVSELADDWRNAKTSC